VRRPDSKALLANHVELHEAWRRQNGYRLRSWLDLIEGLYTCPLAARLAEPMLLAQR